MRRRIRQFLLNAYTSKGWRRFFPAPIAVPFVGLVAPPIRNLGLPHEAQHAHDMMADLLRFTPRGNEAPKLARRFLRERSIMAELFWRPSLHHKARVYGDEHWQAARADGQGCVMILAHIGASWAVPGILGAHGYDVHLIGSAHQWDEATESTGLMGRVFRFMHEEHGGFLGPDRLIPNNTPPERFAAIIAGGGAVAAAFDIPGSAATPFLGRSAALTSGPASLAYHAGVKLLPVTTERRGHRIDLHMLPPLDPADFSDLPALRAAVARIYEEILLRNPAAVEYGEGAFPLVTETAPE